MNASRLLASAAIAIVLTLLRSSLPRDAATNDLDPSWNAVLQYAAKQGLVSGKDIVFTYGPLGHLVSSLHAGGAVYQRMLFEFVFVWLTVVPFVVLALRMPKRWALALLCLVALGPPLMVTGKDGLVQCGLLAWGLLCFGSPAGRLVPPAMALAMLVAIAGLVKFSWLVMGTGTVAAVIADLVLRREWRAAALLATITPVLFIGLWLMQGQPLGGLGAYLAASASIASGYAGAMGVPCKRSVLSLGVGLLLCVGLAIVTTAPDESGKVGRAAIARRALMQLWMSGLTFITWKYGFVRADGHVLMFGMFAGLLPFIVLALPSASPRLDVPRKGLAVVAIILALWMLQISLPGLAFHAPRASLEGLAWNVGTLLDPVGYRISLDESWQRARESLSLPAVKELVKEDSVDVFGVRQTSAIANGLNYTPRPVFQSYSAYNRDLADRNARFYHSGQAPEWVLFELWPIDERLPALEDPSCLVTILRGYRFVADAQPFLLLKKDRVVPLRLILFEAGRGRLGERVDLQTHMQQDIWAEIDVDTAILPLVQTALLRPPGLRIRLELDRAGDSSADQEQPVCNAPAAMLAAGFLLNPLVYRNDDVKQLLVGGRAARVRGFTLEPDHHAKTLSGTGFAYRLYGIAED